MARAATARRVTFGFTTPFSSARCVTDYFRNCCGFYCWGGSALFVNITQHSNAQCAVSPEVWLLWENLQFFFATLWRETMGFLASHRLLQANFLCEIWSDDNCWCYFVQITNLANFSPKGTCWSLETHSDVWSTDLMQLSKMSLLKLHFHTRSASVSIVSHFWAAHGVPSFQFH